MKTVSKMAFGFSTVNAGQRNVSVEPQFIATSTDGGFRVTPPVSKALGVSHGEYIMFLTNVDNIDAAIANRDETLVKFCEDAGLEFGSVEAAIAIHKEFDSFAIAKGIKEYDTKGNVKETQERLSKNDKIRFASQNFEDMVEAIKAERNSENPAKEVVEAVEALEREGVTKEEQIDILAQFVVPRKLPKFKGSKCANPAGVTGTGVVLSFTDTNVWKQLKVDLGEKANTVNRIFDVDIEDMQDVVVSDGFNDVTVKALILGEYTDKEPSRIGGTEE